MQKKVNLTWIAITCLWLLFGLNGWGVTSALAQEPEPRPPLPPIDGSNGGGNGRDHRGNGDHNPGSIPQNGRVSGFVYSYSDRAYMGGIKVVIAGGGWQAETITDSGGFYQFGGLGAGRGIINLQLPPGASPVVFDWPVQLGGGVDLRVNLGYYWQDQSALPAIISGQVTGQSLNLTVKNQTSATLSGSFLEITSPVDLELSPAVTASQGEMADYGPYRLRFAIGAIEPATSIAVNVPLKKISSLSVEPGEAHIRVAFTYDQQRTPLLVHIRSDQAESSAALAANTATATPLPPVSSFIEPADSASPPLISPLPVTGYYLSSTSPAEVILPILLILSLGLAGCYALRTPSSFPGDSERR